MRPGRQLALAGGRTSTRGVRGSSARPDVLDSLLASFIHDDDTVSGLSLGVALEVPLHPKRNRVWASPPRCPPPRETSPVASTSRCEVQSSRELRSAPSTGTQTPMPVSLKSILANLSQTPEDRVPSPAAYLTTSGDGNQGTPWRILKSIRRRTLQEAVIALALDYGSEDDSDDDLDGEDDHDRPVLIPRAQRMFVDTEDDDAELVASVVLTPQPKAESSPPSPLPLSPPPTSFACLLGPVDKFNFEWRALPIPPVAPTERKEVFSEHNCGPTSPFITLYDAFIAIWSGDFLEYIANEKNRYAQEFVEKQFQDGTLGPDSRITHWHDTNSVELYVFLGLILPTGICVKSELAEYWNKDDITAFCATYATQSVSPPFSLPPFQQKFF